MRTNIWTNIRTNIRTANQNYSMIIIRPLPEGRAFLVFTVWFSPSSCSPSNLRKCSPKMTHLIASYPIAQCLLARKHDSLDYAILHNSALPLCYVILHNPALPLYYVILCNAAQPLYYKYMFHKQCTSKLNVHG